MAYLRFYKVKINKTDSIGRTEKQFVSAYDIYETGEEAEQAVQEEGGYIVKTLDLKLKDSK